MEARAIKHDLVRSLLVPRELASHKGQFGHGLLIAGSEGMIGAAVLAAKGCLRSGIGKLTVHSPQCGIEILQIAIPEAMVNKDDSFYSVTDLRRDLSDFSAVALGPGMGSSESTQKFLRNFLSHSTSSLIIDADGLNFLSKNLGMLDFLPNGTILTPHLGEFERLVGSWETTEERDAKQQALSDRYGLVVILKGHNSRISIPKKIAYRNTTGNPGMAKGGSGDVLTGIILGFLAQGYLPETAAVLSVYIHGRAGDLAAEKYSVQGMLPSDLIKEIPNVFLEIQ